MTQANPRILTKHPYLIPGFVLPLILCLGSVAQATVFVYDANLSGANESPVNASPGTGFATVTYDDFAHTLHVQFSYSGLVAGSTAAHIHAATTSPGTGTAGVATTTPYFPGFVTGVSSGTYDNVLDLTSSNSWNNPFIGANGGTPSGAETALAAALVADKAYLNIHSTSFPGGEIRGFLVPVPEPCTIAVAAVGATSLLWARRRRFTS